MTTDIAANLIVAFYTLSFSISALILPALVARSKGKSFAGVLAFTILFPCLGWLMALVWALCLKQPEPRPQVIVVNAMPGIAPVLAREGRFS